MRLRVWLRRRSGRVWTLDAGRARRGRRCPLWAHGGAVSATLKTPLRCSFWARPLNSLHSLRSLRSDKKRQVCSRSALRAPSPKVRYSPPRPIVSPQRAPPAAQASVWQCQAAQCKPSHKAAAGQAPARICGAEHRRVRGRVRSTLRALTCRFLFERSERSERSELSDGHEPEKRRGAGAKRRPPHLRAGACPAVALPRKPSNVGFSTESAPMPAVHQAWPCRSRRIRGRPESSRTACRCPPETGSLFPGLLPAAV
jgi:hypothetical protein